MPPAGDRSPAPGPSGTELLGLGLLIAVAVVVPMVLGLLIDGAARTSPVFLFVGLLIGVVAAGAAVYTRFKRYL